jgi:hypothetical protein
VVLIGLTAIAVSAKGNLVSANYGVSNQLTFSQAVALPGTILPRGSYMFEIARLDSPTWVLEYEKPNGMQAVVVRVTSSDGRRVHFKGFTVRVPRPSELPPDQLVSLGEAPRGQPTPIRTWYPIGESFGQKFIW